MISDAAKAFLKKQGLKTPVEAESIEPAPARPHQLTGQDSAGELRRAGYEPEPVEPLAPPEPPRVSDKAIQHMAAEAQFVPRGMPQPNESDIPSGNVDNGDLPPEPAPPVPEPTPEPQPELPLVHPTTREGLEQIRTEITEQVVEQPIGTDQYPRGSKHDASVENDFERAYDTQPNNYFIDELYTWWDEKGFLTAAQYEKLYFIAYGRMYLGD